MKQIGLLVAFAAALLSGCRSYRPPTETLVLRAAVNDIYCRDTACACVRDVAARTYADTQAQLLEKYNIDLQIDYFIEPYNLEKAILSGAYDVVISKPWTALRLQRRAGTRFERVADVIDPSGNRWLTGIVAVMADSKFQTLEDLQGARIMIGESDSYEKHQAAKRLFKQQGLTFQSLETRASCIENIGLLMDGACDAAVISDYALTVDCAVDFADPADFRILGTTEKIPLTSVLADTRRVPATDRVRLQAALLALTADGAPGSLLSRGFAAPVTWEPEELEE